MALPHPIYAHPSLQDENTRAYLHALQSGTKPPSRPDCGRWTPLVEQAETLYDKTPPQQRSEILTRNYQSWIASNRYPGLSTLLSSPAPRAGQSSQQPALIESLSTSSSFPPLPESVQLPSSLARGACHWLDDYISYSKVVSPEGYADFHEACGLWLLSTIAARRIKIPFTKKQYTPLMILLVADTSLYAKSETADVGVTVLQSAGLRWMLGADRTTPPKLLSDMAGQLPKNYEQMDEDKQYYTRQRLAMSAQRGWRYDEFGELVRAISKSGGVMEDLKGLLLQLDACQDQYEYATQSRGTELIEKPYLALLGCLTPPDMRVSAKAGGNFWSDGFWARFAPVCPPPDTSIDAPFSLGELPVPYALSHTLRDWHDRLGTSTINLVPILDKKEQVIGYDPIRDKPLPETSCSFGEGVYDAWVCYRSALKKIVTSGTYRDFRGSYARLPIKAIRIAALFASLENDNVIELRHWARAQEITERWRRSLHELYAQVNTSPDLELSYTKRIQDDVLHYVAKLESEQQPPTVRDLSRYLTKVEVGKIREVVTDLARSGLLVEHKSAHGTRYTTTKEDA